MIGNGWPQNMRKPLMLEIKNVLPIDIIQTMRQAFLDADYDLIVQERKGHFKRNFSLPQKHIPDHNEIYTSKFFKSRYLETSDYIRSLYLEYLQPIIEHRLGLKVREFDLRCYKMTSGGHFRIHKDDYTADIGFILYLNLDWKWDWGGLLLTIQDNQASVNIPEFNKLILLTHRQGQHPHCVTHVTDYALEPRLMLVGFLK